VALVLIIVFHFQAKATVVITADALVRGGKTTQLKSTVDKALQNCPQVSVVCFAIVPFSQT
jgi:acyl-coenzyme A synthetase/AMP-(fatty) acid ligase